jgi:putative flippase GtrA
MMGKIIEQFIGTVFRGDFILYLVIGAWNTVFGYAVYALFTYILDGYNVKFSYMYAYLLGNMISITQSFVAHKYIVFKSKGNFLDEYKKCWIVYGSTTVLNFFLLPAFVYFSSLILPEQYKMFDKYLGGIATAGISAVIGFVGHTKITFHCSPPKN